MSSEGASGAADTGSPFRFKSAEEAHRYVSASNLQQVKLGVADVDGILRGKYVSREKFLGILDKGFGFCDVIVGWDSNDQLYDNVVSPAGTIGYPMPRRACPKPGVCCRSRATRRSSFANSQAPGEAVCPRGVLRRVLDKCDKPVSAASAAFEYEFFVFEETPDSAR